MSTSIKWDWRDTLHNGLLNWKNPLSLCNKIKNHSNHLIDSLSFSEMWIELWDNLLKELRIQKPRYLRGLVNNVISLSFCLFIWRAGLTGLWLMKESRALGTTSARFSPFPHLEAGGCIKMLTLSFITCPTLLQSLWGSYL